MLHADFETYSELNVREVGAQAYARHPSTEVLMMSYRFDDEPVQLWVPDGPWDYDSFPKRVRQYIACGGLVCAHNIEFEVNIFFHVLGIHITWPQCRDTAVIALVHGFPMSLDGAASAVGLPVQKDNRGKVLIRKFCQPRKPSKNNPATRWYPETAPEDWEDFKNYCIQDTVVEHALWHKFGGWPLSEFEQRVYEMSLEMNERGLPVATALAAKTLEYIDDYSRRRAEECVYITDGVKPTQVQELLKWVQLEVLNINNLQRATIEHLFRTNKKLDPEVKEVLTIRLEQGRVSTKKLAKMIEMDSGDAVARGCFIYHGAGPGRYTAKRLQPHNFIRPTIKEVDYVTKLIESEQFSKIEKEYKERTLEAIGSCMRGYIQARAGQLLLVADYSAIEARILAWLACQHDLVEAFHNGKDVYCDMAGYVFKLDPVEIEAGHKADILKFSEYRKLGKDTVLGCGYNMGIEKFLLQMEGKGSDKIAGILIRRKPEDRGKKGRASFNPKAWQMAADAVYGYRKRYDKIPKLWKNVEKAAKAAIKSPGIIFTISHKRLKFRMEGDALVMRLPSGRKIRYPHAELYERENKWKPGIIEEAIRFRVVNEKTGKWVWETTYGGKLVENAVQAIARDLMVFGMLNCRAAGYALIGTVHDEIMTLIKAVRARKRAVKKFCALICILPDWAKHKHLRFTIPLAAEGYCEKRFKK